MKSDFNFFDINLQPIGDILYDIPITDKRIWNAFNAICAKFEGQAIPVKKLSKGMKKILEDKGMPQNAEFIQR
jgi:hypothetical protein